MQTNYITFFIQFIKFNLLSTINIFFKNIIKELKAFEVLKELLLLEVREIGGKYYIKYRNIEEDNYIDYEISEELYEVLKWAMNYIKIM